MPAPPANAVPAAMSARQPSTDRTVGLWVDGVYATGDLDLDEAGLHEGAIVSLDRPAIADGVRGPADPAPETDPSSVWLCVLAGAEAGMTRPLAPGRYRIGRADYCEIRIDQPGVAAEHAVLELLPGADATVAPGTPGVDLRVDGVAVEAAQSVGLGSFVRIGTSAFDLRYRRTSDRPVGVGRPDHPATETTNFNRPPRVLTKPPDTSLTPPEAPATVHKQPFLIAAMVAPLLMAGVMIGAGGSHLFALFALLSPVMFIGSRWETSHRAKGGLRNATSEYESRLGAFHAELENAYATQTRYLRSEFPDPSEALRRASSPSVRLWERRPTHYDFMELVVGYGDNSWQPLADQRKPPTDDVADLLHTYAVLRETPVRVDVSAGGVIGFTGDRAGALAVARSLVCQAAALHGPADVRITVVVAKDSESDWEWTKWLPHTLDLRPGEGERRLLVDGIDGSSEMLEGLLPAEPLASDRRGRQGEPRGPVTLYVIDGDELLAGHNNPARRLLRGDGGPAAGIVIVESHDRLPAVCSEVITIDQWGTGTLVDAQGGAAPRPFSTSGVSVEAARSCAVSLSRFFDPEVAISGGALPDTVHIRSLLGGAGLSPELVAERWSRSRFSRVLRAPVGMAESGVFELDLDRHGPHGLIGGTTGSGKSELLKTVVAMFAATYSPSELVFGLFDFKGGATFDEFKHLPHTVGMASDLDVNLARRAVRCLKAEMTFREGLFMKAGAKDLDTIRARQSAGDPAALALGDVPRLLVIFDEFAAAKEELAEEVRVITDVTARGRSLGIHLLLAAQKPSTSITPEIRTNSRLRIALLMEDAQDSKDLIDIPDAAGLRQSGRAFFRIAATEMRRVQTAWASDRTSSAGPAAVSVVPFVFGRVPHPPEPSRAMSDLDPTDLDRLVASIQRAFDDSGAPSPRVPWPDPLPQRLTLGELTPRPPGALAGDRGIYFALADDPAHQSRYPVGWDLSSGNLLLFGVVGSGTTTALASIALVFADSRSQSDGHLYVMDFGAGELVALAALPHCAGVIGASDRERQVRLVRLLRAELDRRRALTPSEREDQPRIMLLIDNYAGFRAAAEEPELAGVSEAFERVFNDGPDVGIHTAMSAARLNAVSAVLAAAAPNKLLFRLADPNDYGAAQIQRRELPTFVPGRAVLAVGRLTAQIAVPDPDLEVAVALIAANGRPGQAGPRRLGSLPAIVRRADVITKSRITPDCWSLAIGVRDHDLEASHLRLFENEHALVAGPARSGKSTALVTIAEALRAEEPGAHLLAIACRRSPLRDHALFERLAIDGSEIPELVDAAMMAVGATLLLIDDADQLDDSGSRIAGLIGARRPNIHLAISGRPDVVRSLFGHWTQAVRRSRIGVLLQPNLTVDSDIFGITLPRRVHLAIPPGRGFLACDGSMELVQLAT
jgi:S-DNA-T family DNA segregation ATPase FtsK/SpoIIIE